jgi:hypothetical protein
MSIALRDIELTDEEKELACHLINNYGDGMHPMAEYNTIDGFYTSFLKSIMIRKEVANDIKKQGEEIQEIFEELLHKL